MSKTVRKSNKYIFILRNVKTDKVDKKYGITLISNITEEDNPPKNTTKLSDLTSDKATPEIISFLDESKQLHKCTVSMIDFNSKREAHLLRYNCYWDKHSFNTRSIGCPINFISNQATKHYYSEISKDTYTIKENITNMKSNNIKDQRITVDEKSYYETDGIFCSFNCAKAYIDENKHNRMYDNSAILLSMMYNDMIGDSEVPLIIDPAPHWRLLHEYGGYMNIMEYRNSFSKADYDYHGVVKNFPQFISIGTLFEEKLKF
jgi:hypothetical protein